MHLDFYFCLKYTMEYEGHCHRNKKKNGTNFLPKKLRNSEINVTYLNKFKKNSVKK